MFSCSPKEAVVSAYEYSRMRKNTWQYPKFKDHPQHIEGKWTVLCGDYCAYKFRLRYKEVKLSTMSSKELLEGVLYYQDLQVMKMYGLKGFYNFIKECIKSYYNKRGEKPTTVYVDRAYYTALAKKGKTEIYGIIIQPSDNMTPGYKYCILAKRKLEKVKNRRLIKRDFIRRR